MATVSVGGLPATNVTVVDDGRIDCTFPAHADGAVPVIVTTFSGSSAPFTFTYQSGLPAPGAPKAWLAWMDPVYYVRGSGTKTVATAGRFDGAVTSYSLRGTLPTGVSIDGSTGVISISTDADMPWTTLRVRATNANGYAELDLDVWVFTPSYTISGGAPLNSVTPLPGQIVAVRAATYTTVQELGAYNGADGNPVKLVAYPGDRVVFDCSSMAGYGPDGTVNQPLHIVDVHDLEVRGFEFDGKATQAGGGCFMAFWGNRTARLTVAQCKMHHFYYYGCWLGTDSPTRDVVEYCDLWDNSMNNYPTRFTDPNNLPWGPAINIANSTSLVRRNRIHHNHGEGVLVNASSTYAEITENIVSDSWSINLYACGAQGTLFHGNIVWTTDSGQTNPGWGIQNTIAGSNEGGACTGVVATNNWIYSGNFAPRFTNFKGGDGGNSVWTPNWTFDTVDPRWLSSAP